MGPGVAGGTYQEALDRGLHLGEVGVEVFRAPGLHRGDVVFDERLRRRMGTANRQRVEGCSWDAHVAALLRLAGVGTAPESVVP